MPVNVALDVIYELPGSHFRCSTVAGDRLWVPDNIPCVGVRIGVKKRRCPVYPLLVGKVDLPRLRLPAKVLGKRGIVLLC
jgi:hypothetical protein